MNRIGRWFALVWLILVAVGIVCSLLGLGAGMLWFSKRVNAAELSCQDPRLLDAVRRSIAETRLNESILRLSWGRTIAVPTMGDRPQCWGVLGPSPYDTAGTFRFGWRTFEGKTYLRWETDR